MFGLMRLPFFFILLLAILPASNLSTGQDEGPGLEGMECPADFPENLVVDCAYLNVPEDYDDPEGRMIQLPIYLLHSWNTNPAPDPLLFMTGFPGASGVPAVLALADSAVLQDRDILLLEQRGSDLAKPNLECETLLLSDEALPCLENLRARGIDLDHYRIASMAADLHALRQTLGYEEWNLYGNAFSSLIMLAALDQDPQGIRSLVLDSGHQSTAVIHETVSQNFVSALGSLFDECAQDPACSAAYPDLAGQFYFLVDHLNANPLPVEVTSQSTGQRINTELDGNWLLAQTYDAMYGHLKTNEPLPYWPLLIGQLETGNIEFAKPWLANPVVNWEELLNFGLYYSVICQDIYPSADPELLEEQTLAYPALATWSESTFARQTCAAWDLPRNSSLTSDPEVGDVPTLILAGTHDPINPPAWGKDIAKTFSRSYAYEFPGMGNWVSVADPCAQNIMRSFLKDPQAPPDDACLAQRDESHFVLPGDIYLDPGIYRFLNDTKLPGLNMPLTGALWFSLLLFATELIYLVVMVLRRLVTGPLFEGSGGRLARFAHLLAALAVILNLGFFVLFTRVLDHLATSSPMVLRFGLPSEFGSIFIIPLVTEVMTAGMLVITFLIWILGYWSTFQRVYFSLITLAGVIFTSLLAYWGFLSLS